MATSSGNSPVVSSSETQVGNVPQWKRDLIQRRKQQNKTIGSVITSVKQSAIGALRDARPAGADAISDECGARVVKDDCEPKFVRGVSHSQGKQASPTRVTRIASSGATNGACRIATNNDSGSTAVACNMRLEADLSICSDAEDVVNGKAGSGDNVETECEMINDSKRTKVKSRDCAQEENNRLTTRRSSSGRTERDVLAELSCANTIRRCQFDSNTMPRNEDPESDSSEELQYGPGIVNRLKSKYLNLTLRETNKTRASVQRFRRAASLENLLDCDEEGSEGAITEKNSVVRKYTKRNCAPVKNDRFRNASRGNESMKRARSVETLMRYNNGLDETAPICRPKEPVNDHIILIDRSAGNVESRLSDLDRPKPVNKPKRVKPVLAETERPPPDLVKTTMRIFEGSARKLKPKGEVAAKVATFKTINDTFKAQTHKKIVPKPPIQPKPFTNGNSRLQSSPKKIILPQKPTAELIEKQDSQEEFHIEGVITDPIVQSVSSVVSKFQQIEKSHSPSPSPEPTAHKLKFSPASSPEPFANKSKSSLEINVKSPPVTPVLSPKVVSPLVQSPASPKREPPCRTSLVSCEPTSPIVEEITRDETVTEIKSENLQDRVQSSVEEIKDKSDITSDLVDVEDAAVVEECVDGPKTISKSALENIGKAGVTMQFDFGDKSSVAKSYLPGVNNRQKSEADRETKISSNAKATSPSVENKPNPQERLIEPDVRCERNNGESNEESKNSSITENKPIGAICSLGLMRPSSVNSNEKINKCQKTESPPQKQIGIIRPLVSTKSQHQQQNLSNRELEKNLINRVKSIEQPTKVVVSLKSADEIQPAKKTGSSGGGGGGGLWDTKPWNQQNNTMVFNFSNRKDVPDYIENDGLFIRRKREKSKVGDGGIIVLDATLDASTTDDSEWEISGGPPSPCDVAFLNDNILINGRSNLSRQPRNHKHRIQFDDTATRTFEYPSEASMLEGETSCIDGGTTNEQPSAIGNKTTTGNSSPGLQSLLGSSGLASYTPCKVDLTTDGFELGVTRTVPLVQPTATTATVATPASQQDEQIEDDYLKPAQDAGAWGSETTGDLLY